MENPRIISANFGHLGDLVEIDSIVYRIADRFGNANTASSSELRIDLFVPEGHEAALALGVRRNVEVYWIDGTP